MLDHLAHAALSRALATFAAPAVPLLVDATAGNGQDSLFLAQNAPPGARLLCLDVQESAVRATRALLAGHGLADMARVLQRGHEDLAAILEELAPAGAEHAPSDAPPLGCVVFNLGWLPGGPRNMTTTPDKSLTALEAALSALAPGGCISLHCYTGHAGGAEEAALLARRVRELPPRRWRVLSLTDVNRPERVESLLLLERLPVKRSGRAAV